MFKKLYTQFFKKYGFFCKNLADRVDNAIQYYILSKKDFILEQYNIIKNKLFKQFIFLTNFMTNQSFFFKKINIFAKTIIFKYKDYLYFFFKKYIYTINHKRIAMNYLFFSFWSGLSGASLATMIRLELAYPGSHFFKGDSIKYLQVITGHGLIMVFFVVVPIIFGFFANFFIPYHIGSKDVSFPRLNSIGFWLLPTGFILLTKSVILRRQIFKNYDNSSNYTNFLKKYNTKNNFKLNYDYLSFNNFKTKTNNYLNFNVFFTKNFKNNTNLHTTGNNFYKNYFLIKNNFKILNTNNIKNFYESYWNFFFKLNKSKVIKSNFVTKCSSSNYTMSGWTFITPFSSNLKYTGFGSQDIAIIGVIFAGVSTTISFTNLLITRRTLSMPGLRNRKNLIPFLSITLFLVMRMLALITPVLAAAMIMLLMDRHFKTSFFDYTYGGDLVLFHHLFWFFGHPEVYVVMIPGFGIINMLLPYHNTRRITSKNHLVWTTYVMAYMGFLVWGHHMYLIGLDNRSRSLFSTITLMIALPAVVKLVNWTFTLANGTIKWDVSLLFSLSFLLFFLSGGLTGMWLSHVALNLYIHDTFYVVAHFHFLFSSAVFSAIFAGIYYYFPVIFGIKYSRFFAYYHLLYWNFGQWMTFTPLYWVGYNGLPRRYHDYPVIFVGWQGMATGGHIITLISLLFFFIMILDSHILNKSCKPLTLGIPRFYKRIQYYTFKIKYLQKNKISNIMWYKL